MVSKQPDISFQEIASLIYAGPAIIHADTFYSDELYAGNIKDVDIQIFSILEMIGLVNSKGHLTPTGNEVFASVDLIRYYLITGSEMAIHKKPPKVVWQYDLLRKGLGQHAYTRSIDYLDFLKTYLKHPLETVLDIGGGDGTYLALIGEQYEINRGILIDKDLDAAHFHFEHTHPNSERYTLQEADISMSLNIAPYVADLTLVNEVLHLHGDMWWDHLITEALLNTKPGGQICIGEVQPESAFDWRMKSYTDEGHSLHMAEFMQWLHSIYRENFEENFGVLEMNTHWFVILTKKGEHDVERSSLS